MASPLFTVGLMFDPAGYNPTAKASLWHACTAALYLDAASYMCPAEGSPDLLSPQTLATPLPAYSGSTTVLMQSPL